MGQPGRPEQPLDPTAGPVQRLAVELRELRRAAGSPTYRELAGRTGGGYSAATLSRAASGARLPSLGLTLAYAEACGGGRAEWAVRWRQAAAELRGAAPPRRAAETDRAPAARGARPVRGRPVRAAAVRDAAVRDRPLQDRPPRPPDPAVRDSAVRDSGVRVPEPRDPVPDARTGSGRAAGPRRRTGC